jgi:segregation and condensation protein A
MAYRVELPVFCGPLDLLLHLVRQQEVDIHEVRIASILEQYLDHLRVLQELSGQLDLGDLGDFLVLASTLMEIKSREMLPTGEEVEVEEAFDPRDDLIRRLLEYKRYRDVARRLDRMADRRARMFPVHLGLPQLLADEPEPEPDFDLGDVEIWSLTAAFAKLLQETGQQKRMDIGVDRRDVRYWAKCVLERTRGRREVPFRDLFTEETVGGPVTRLVLIGVFVACLEMMKQGVLRAHQVTEAAFGEIVVIYVGPEDVDSDQILAGGRRVDADDEELPATDVVDEAAPS